MNTLLELLGNRLLATSVQTVLLTALVWLLCRYVRRLPASTQCGLWWLVALQAVLGLLWAAPLELPLLPATQAAPLVQQTAAVLPAVVPSVVTALPQESGSGSWLQLAMALWLAGVAVMALRTASAWRASRALLHGAQPCRDRKLDAALTLSRPMLMHFYLLMVTKLPISMSAIYNTDFMSVSIEIEMLTQTL